jgi:hypothetical protein
MVGKRQADERAWFGKEVEASEFQDARLHKRFGIVLAVVVWHGPDDSLRMSGLSLDQSRLPIPIQRSGQ